MPPDRVHSLPFFARASAEAPANAAVTFDSQYVSLVAQARSSKTPFFIRQHAFLHLTLRSLEAGDRERTEKWLERWSHLLELVPLTPAAKDSQEKYIQEFRLLADGNYLGAWKHLRKLPPSFQLKALQNRFSRYWQKNHGWILLQFLKTATEPSQEAEAVWLRLQKEFEETGSLTEAFRSLDAADQAWLQGRWPEEMLAPLFSVSKNGNPEAFVNQLLELAAHWKKSGHVSQARALLRLLEDKESARLFSYPIPDNIRNDATRLANGEIRDVGGPSFGLSVEEALASWTFSDWNHGFQAAGAWVGLATIACAAATRVPWLAPLRPWAARGIFLLSDPAIAAALLASGSYGLYEGRTRVGAAWKNLVGPSGSFDDALTVLGYSLGALALGVGMSSFAMGARYGRRFGLNARALEPGKGGAGSTEAWRMGWNQWDAGRRAAMDPEVWVAYARSAPNLATVTRKTLEYGARAIDWTLMKGTLLYATGRFVHDQAQSESTSQADIFLQLGLNLFPAVTLQLYRAGRGNRNYHQGPALSQELNQSVYANAAHRETVLARMERGLPPLTIHQKDLLHARARRELSQVEELLARGQTAAPIPPPPLLALLPESYPQNSFLPPDWFENAPVPFSSEARLPPDLKQAREALAGMDLLGLRRAYRSGRVSPVGVLHAILDHPAVQDGAIFPRSLDRGALGRALLRLARESERRWETGSPRILDGVFIAVKDLFAGPDGIMMGGTKAGKFTGIESNPVVQTLLELGAIPLPVGMVAAANGGTGLDSGFGHVPHPIDPTLDPAGSSSGVAYAVGKSDLPVHWGIGTDTGGSVTAPAGAVGLSSFVPPAGLLSTQNMIPFFTRLDRVGVLSRFSHDTQLLALLLAKQAPGDPHMRTVNPGRHFHASPIQPRIAYLEDLVNRVGEKFDPTAQRLFLEKMEALRAQGWEVIPLGSDWNFFSQIPRILYPWVAYPAAAFTHTNPLQANRFEAPRRTLDKPLLARLPFGAFSLENGYFDRAMALGERSVQLALEKLGPGVLLASPAPVAVPKRKIQEAQAGDELDLHDDITMYKNWETNSGQIVRPYAEDPRFGIALTGPLPDLLHYLERPKLRTVPLTISPGADEPAGLPLPPAIDLETFRRASEVRALRPHGEPVPRELQAAE